MSPPAAPGGQGGLPAGAGGTTPTAGMSGGGGTPGGQGGGPATGGSPGSGGSAGETGGSPDGGNAPDTSRPPTVDGGPVQAGWHATLGPEQPVVGPVVADECPGDLKAGFSEYTGAFKVQLPYDLQEDARYKLENGIYTIFIKMGDKAHAPGNTTRERTEFRYEDISTGQHLWSGDFLLQAPSTHVCIFQVKNSGPPTGVYLRVDGGNMHQLGGGNILNGIYDKWYNLKVLVDTAAATGKVYINNCLKQTVNMPRGSGTWYFKNGTYTCDSPVCTALFKNIHLYKK